MSADDYMLINYDTVSYRWIVGRGFTSDDEGPNLCAESRCPGFVDFGEAWDYAQAEDAEYGVRMTAAARARLAGGAA